MRLIPPLPWLSVCALLFTAPVRAADPAAAAPAVELVFDLSDGSRVIGVPETDHLKMATSYASMDMQLSQLALVEFSRKPKDAGNAGEGARVKLRNGDILNVKLSATEIAAKTLFGEAKIPLAQVARIHVNVKGGPGATLPEGLVLHYTFDSDENGKVTDASGTGNDATVIGATYVDEGKIGGAMSFNGLHQAVVLKKPTGLDNQDFTIMAWIKRGDKNLATRAGSSGLLFSYGQNGYGLAMVNSGALALTKIGISNVASDFQISDEEFHHVVVTKKGAKIVFYLDGAAHPAPDYDEVFEFNTGVSVSCRTDTMNESFVGLIDEVAVFNRGLTADEVKGIYDAQK